jgi:uncharacterized protein (DUF1810 family)
MSTNKASVEKKVVDQYEKRKKKKKTKFIYFIFMELASRIQGPCS